MKIGITGRHGFIGSALAHRLGKSNTFYPYPRKDLDILFLFGSPSSNLIFDQNIDYCFEETINNFLTTVQYCRDNGIKLVYPSSATIYNQNTSYAKCKAILELIHKSYGGDILGFRIFAGYGPGEAIKGEYASVVYQFCKDMVKGKSPVVYGDGSQTRDFVYIDDIVDNIVGNLDKTGIIDIGTGRSTSFNRLIQLINEDLGTNIIPRYQDKPVDYISETNCESPIPCKVSLEDGIHSICKSLKGYKL